MSPQTPDDFADFDAAYVLGALSAIERDEFEAHLAGCVDCQARVDELRGLPALLALAPASAYVRIAPEIDPVVSLLAVARSRQRRRRLLAAAVATVAAACLITVTALIARNPAKPAPAAATVSVPQATMSAVSASPIHATVELADVAWGTSIRLHCTYDEAATYPSDEEYSLVVTSWSGQSATLGTWVLVPGKVTTFPAGTALHKSDIKSIMIDTPSGTPLLQLSY